MNYDVFKAWNVYYDTEQKKPQFVQLLVKIWHKPSFDTKWL